MPSSRLRCPLYFILWLGCCSHCCHCCRVLLVLVFLVFLVFFFLFFFFLCEQRGSLLVYAQLVTESRVSWRFPPSHGAKSSPWLIGDLW